MNQYQKEQLDALKQVRHHLKAMARDEEQRLKESLTDYLDFRHRVSAFLDTFFSSICTEKCYAGRLSACCSKDGILTFFGDVVVNALTSSPEGLDRLETAIIRPERDIKCIFLSDNGCLWQMKPIVCEMFLCDEAEQNVFGDNTEAHKKWAAYKEERKNFTWPDKRVLFEELERVFIEKDVTSPIMYIHFSPGLLRIKKNREKQSTPRQ
jgi:hypothetical protein